MYPDPAPAVGLCRVDGAGGLATADEDGCGQEPLGRRGFDAAPIGHDISTRACLEGLVDIVRAHLELAVQVGAAAKAFEGRWGAHFPLQLLQALRDIREAEDFPRQLGGLQQSNNCPTDGLPARGAWREGGIDDPTPAAVDGFGAKVGSCFVPVFGFDLEEEGRWADEEGFGAAEVWW